MDETVIIESNEDLDAINQKLSENEQLCLTDLDTWTYFFIKMPRLPEFLAYRKHSYNDRILNIQMDIYEFTELSPAMRFPERYTVFRAQKKR